MSSGAASPGYENTFAHFPTWDDYLTAQGGYTCLVCGQWVPVGLTHQCPGWTYPLGGSTTLRYSWMCPRCEYYVQGDHDCLANLEAQLHFIEGRVSVLLRMISAEIERQKAELKKGDE